MLTPDTNSSTSSSGSSSTSSSGTGLHGHIQRARLRWPSRPLRVIDRARHHARHRTLALTLGAYLALWHRRIQPGVRPTRAALRDLRRSLDGMLAADLANVEAGHYPRELLHDIPYGEYLRVMPELFLEQPAIFRRARDRRHEDLPAAAHPEQYPAYYRRTFHWQTDGWLSHRSARLYDLSVELLFGGVADVMRRMTLPPLVTGVRHLPHPRVLDVACGTGRFLDTVRRILPSAHLSGVDLSPFYVSHARARLGGAPHVALSVQNAESLAFGDASFDAVSSVFLFHELPRNVRRNVVREALRVLRPGARLVICDAAQQCDVDARRFFLESFPSLYHEPYFKSYLRDDLERLLEEVGFEIESSQVHFLVKVVSARRPSGT
jgi:ubiquinone/menaquinone biosynthesis C-methylase UbiE